MDDEIVTVATFGTAAEAEMARGYLEANGIEVFLGDEAMSRIASHLAPMIGGVKLQVRREDEELVRQLLSEAGSDPED
jgi:hypothetical protein